MVRSSVHSAVRSPLVRTFTRRPTGPGGDCHEFVMCGEAFTAVLCNSGAPAAVSALIRDGFLPWCDCAFDARIGEVRATPRSISAKIGTNMDAVSFRLPYFTIRAPSSVMRAKRPGHDHPDDGAAEAEAQPRQPSARMVSPNSSSTANRRINSPCLTAKSMTISSERRFASMPKRSGSSAGTPVWANAACLASRNSR
jgi:hypothetical protein